MNTLSKNSAFGLLGLARRAGMLEQGVASTRQALKQGRAMLIWMAKDGSETQKDKIVNLLRHKNVPVVTCGTCADLGSILGSDKVAAVAITSAGMANQMLARLTEDSELMSGNNSMEIGE
jgi:ribosomal protein L7Ae-like RNA K-turn-binding protein